MPLSADFDPNDPDALDRFFERRNQPSAENPTVSETEVDFTDPEYEPEPVIIQQEHAGTTDADRELNAILKKAGIKPERKERKRQQQVKVVQPVITPFELDIAQLCKDFDELVEGLSESQKNLRVTHFALSSACNRTNDKEVCKIAESVRSQVWSLGGVRRTAEMSRVQFCRLR